MIELSDYTIVERANIDKILKEQKFQHSGCTDSEYAVECSIAIQEAAKDLEDLNLLVSMKVK